MPIDAQVGLPQVHACQRDVASKGVGLPWYLAWEQP